MCLLTQGGDDGQGVQEGSRVAPLDVGDLSNGHSVCSRCCRGGGLLVGPALQAVLPGELVQRGVQPGDLLGSQSGPVLLVENVQVLRDVPQLVERLARDELLHLHHLVGRGRLLVDGRADLLDGRRVLVLDAIRLPVRRRRRRLDEQEHVRAEQHVHEEEHDERHLGDVAPTAGTLFWRHLSRHRLHSDSITVDPRQL